MEKNIVNRLKGEVEKLKIANKNLDISLAANKKEIQIEIEKRKLAEDKRDTENINEKANEENRDIEMRKNRIVKVEKNRNILLNDRLSVTLQNELRRSKSFSFMRGDGLQNPAPRMTQSLRSLDLKDVLKNRNRVNDDYDSYPSPAQSSEQRRGCDSREKERESSEWDGVQSQDDVRASLYSDQSLRSEEAFEIKIRDELKLTILTMARQHAAERETLCVQIETLKDKIATLSTQNKNQGSSSSSALPFFSGPPSLSPRRNDPVEGLKENERGAGTRPTGVEIMADEVHDDLTYNDKQKDVQMELQNIKLALSTEITKNASLTALLDGAKSKILSLTSQLSHDRSTASLNVRKERDMDMRGDRNRLRDSSTSPLPLPLPTLKNRNVSNASVEDIEDLQAKLRWSGRHHTVMCRAVLLLERSLIYQLLLLLFFCVIITADD